MTNIGWFEDTVVYGPTLDIARARLLLGSRGQIASRIVEAKLHLRLPEAAVRRA